MILDGKYIVVDRYDMSETLDILYKLGYDFAISLDNIDPPSIKSNDFFIYSNFNSRIILYTDHISDFNNLKNIKEKTTIKTILRENKLKRILKSK